MVVLGNWCGHVFAWNRSRLMFWCGVAFIHLRERPSNSIKGNVQSLNVWLMLNVCWWICFVSSAFAKVSNTPYYVLIEKIMEVPLREESDERNSSVQHISKKITHYLSPHPLLPLPLPTHLSFPLKKHMIIIFFCFV